MKQWAGCIARARKYLWSCMCSMSCHCNNHKHLRHIVHLVFTGSSYSVEQFVLLFSVCLLCMGEIFAIEKRLNQMSHVWCICCDSPSLNMWMFTLTSWQQHTVCRRTNEWCRMGPVGDIYILFATENRFIYQTAWALCNWVILIFMTVLYIQMLFLLD